MTTKSLGFALALALAPDLAFAQSTSPTATAPDIAITQLKRMAELSVAEIADEAEAIKARMDQQIVVETAARDDRTERVLLKQQFQRDFATAANAEARAQLLAVYLAMTRVQAAQRELALQTTKPTTGGN